MSEETSKECDYSKPFRVRVIRDCRENIETKLDGQFGVCLGKYEYPDIAKKKPEEIDTSSVENVLKYNPLIRMDNGDYIWGIECWFAEEEWSKAEPLDKLNSALEGHIDRIRSRHQPE